MATKFLEPGGDATFNAAITTSGGFWSSGTTGATVATDFVHGNHIKSIKYRPNNLDEVATATGVIADAGARISFYLYINVQSGATNTITILANTSDVPIIRIRITSGGVLQLWDNTVQLGGDGSTLSAGVWHRISLAYTITSKTVNRFELFVNGTSSLSLTNVTIGATGTSKVAWGNLSPSVLLDIRTSDHYIDNSTALTDPGDIWVIAKRSFANGTSNQFTTQIGSGGSGYGSGHSPQVNERPLSTTNGWSLSNTTKSTEEYNIESQAGGDFNIINATIVDYMGWIYSKVDSTANSPVHHIIVNNSATAITEATSANAFTAIAGSTTYPAGTGTDIGIDAQYTTTPHTTSLYECGIVFAVIFNSPVMNSRIKPL